MITRVLAIAISLAFTPLKAHSNSECGDVFEQGIPPKDYSDPKMHAIGKGGKSAVYVVENRHFTPNVRNLIRGESTTDVMPDLDYTLGKFPNHYEALWSLIKYDQRLNGKLPQIQSKKFPQTIKCYFERAFQFKPTDGLTRQLYGTYFHLNKKYDEALEQYKIADSYMDSAELDYNIGLLYFEMGKYEDSKEYAVKAYNNNYPLPALKNKLKGVDMDLDN